MWVAEKLLTCKQLFLDLNFVAVRVAALGVFGTKLSVVIGGPSIGPQLQFVEAKL